MKLSVRRAHEAIKRSILFQSHPVTPFLVATVQSLQNQGTLAQRAPTSTSRVVGDPPRRVAVREIDGLSVKLPPRITRLVSIGYFAQSIHEMSTSGSSYQSSPHSNTFPA